MAGLLDPSASATAVHRFSAEGVRFVRINHADPHGRCRSKELPIDSLALAGSEGSSHHVHASLRRGEDNSFDDGGNVSAYALVRSRHDRPRPGPDRTGGAHDQLLQAPRQRRAVPAATDWEWREYATHA